MNGDLVVFPFLDMKAIQSALFTSRVVDFNHYANEMRVTDCYCKCRFIPARSRVKSRSMSMHIQTTCLAFLGQISVDNRENRGYLRSIKDP